MEGEEASGEKKTKFGFFHGQSITVQHIHTSLKYLMEKATDCPADSDGSGLQVCKRRQQLMGHFLKSSISE